MTPAAGPRHPDPGRYCHANAFGDCVHAAAVTHLAFSWDFGRVRSARPGATGRLPIARARCKQSHPLNTGATSGHMLSNERGNHRREPVEQHAGRDERDRPECAVPHVGQTARATRIIGGTETSREPRSQSCRRHERRTGRQGAAQPLPRTNHEFDAHDLPQGAADLLPPHFPFDATGSHSSTLFPSGSRIHANVPFSSDSGPFRISPPFCCSFRHVVDSVVDHEAGGAGAELPRVLLEDMPYGLAAILALVIGPLEDRTAPGLERKSQVLAPPSLL